MVLNGWGVGEVHYGGYSQMARVSGDWLIPLPEGLSGAEAMALGTAGYTAMLALLALEKHGVTPEAGPVVVTGAAGGVGSVAVALLAGAGYTVHAVTGRPAKADYLKALGASEIVARDELTGPPKLLAKERWAAGVDSVGGTILANVLSMTQGRTAPSPPAAMPPAWSCRPRWRRSSCAAWRFSASTRSPCPSPCASRRGSVSPAISTAASSPAMTTTIGFDDIVPAARDIAEGKVRGRLVVEIG